MFNVQSSMLESTARLPSGDYRTLSEPLHSRFLLIEPQPGPSNLTLDLELQAFNLEL